LGVDRFEDIAVDADPEETAGLYAERVIMALADGLADRADEAAVVRALIAAMDPIPDRALLPVFDTLRSGDPISDALIPDETTLGIVRDFSHDMCQRLLRGEEANLRSRTTYEVPEASNLLTRGLRGLQHQRFEERERAGEEALRRIAAEKALLLPEQRRIAHSNVSDQEIHRLIDELVTDIPAEEAVLVRLRPWVNSHLMQFPGYSEEFLRAREEEKFADLQRQHGDPDRGPRIAQNAERLAGVAVEQLAPILIARSDPSSLSAFQRHAESWRAYLVADQLDPDQLRAAFRNQDDSILPARFRRILVGGRDSALFRVVHAAERWAEVALFDAAVNSRGYASPSLRGARDVAQAAGRHLLRNAMSFGLLPESPSPSVERFGNTGPSNHPGAGL
jgi:hypothetical protein